MAIEDFSNDSGFEDFERDQVIQELVKTIDSVIVGLDNELKLKSSFKDIVNRAKTNISLSLGAAMESDTQKSTQELVLLKQMIKEKKFVSWLVEKVLAGLRLRHLYSSSPGKNTFVVYYYDPNDRASNAAQIIEVARDFSELGQFTETDHSLTNKATALVLNKYQPDSERLLIL